MADIDELLKGSFERLAEPENSAGVADLIRSRVAAGDAGTSAPATTAPGWTAPRPRWFWPLVGTVIGLATALAVLVTVVAWPAGVDPAPTLEPSPTVSVTPTPSPTPTETPTPTPTPTPTQTPEDDPQPPPPPPPAPRDQTAPTIAAGQWSPGFVYGTQTPCGGTTSDIVITATDDVAVVSIGTTTTLPGTTVTLISSNGSAHTYRFTGIWPPNQQDTVVTVTFTAQDAAGNASSVATSITNAFTCIT